MQRKLIPYLLRSKLRWWIVVSIAPCLLGTGCVSSSAPVENAAFIGVVNPQRVLNDTNTGKRVTEALNSFMKDRQALVDLEQRELRKLENELLTQGSVLSQKARQQREEQFRRRMAEYQQKIADLNREVQEKQKELLAEFRSKVETVVEKIAQERELIIVLEYGTGTSTLYHQPKLDITDQVIQELNRGF